VLDVGLINSALKNIVAKSDEVETESNQAEYCDECCGSKRTALPITMMIDNFFHPLIRRKLNSLSLKEDL
jgi:hypothetical protein